MEAKHIRWRFNGNERLDELDADLGGEMGVPQQGHTVIRNGKTWSVLKIEQQQFLSFPKPIPTYLVHLQEMI